MIKLSKEIKQIITLKQKNVFIKAGSATGKTTALCEYAKAHPNKKMLYITQDESASKTVKAENIENISCRTLYGMAYKAKGIPLKHKLVNHYRLTDVKNVLNIEWGLVQEVINTLNRFVASSDKKIDVKHCEKYEPSVSTYQLSLFTKIVEQTRKLWEMAFTSTHSCPVTMAMCIKAFVNDEVVLGDYFEVLLIDDLQEFSLAEITYLLKQSMPKIITCDVSAVQPDKINGCFDKERFLLEVVEQYHFIEKHLTRSYRFGRAITDLANSLLYCEHQLTQNKLLQLSGDPKLPSSVVPLAQMQKGKHCIITRTYAGAILAAITSGKKTLYWVGGLQRYYTQELLDVYYLSCNQKSRVVRKKLLVDHKSYQAYVQQANKTQDQEMLTIIAAIKQLGQRLPKEIAALKRRTVKIEQQAQLMIAVIYYCKGSEWTHVRLGDDFIAPFSKESRLSKHAIIQEIHWLYLSITRCMLQLTINQAMQNVIAYAQAQFQKQHKDRKFTISDSDESLLQALKQSVNKSKH